MYEDEVMATASASKGTDYESADLIRETSLQRSLRRWNVGLCVLAFIGAATALGGLTIGFITLSELAAASTKLYTCAAILIGCSFVSFGLAAHCLDKGDALDKQVRLERCARKEPADGTAVPYEFKN